MIIKLIDELEPSFTTHEKKLSAYIKNNIREAKKMNAYEMADKVGISQPTIIRFSKKLGYKGYPEMRIAINKEDSETGTVIHQEINVNDSLYEATKKIIGLSNSSLQSVLSYFDESLYDETIKKIYEAKKIMLFGLGGSGIVAKDFSQKLLKIGKHVFYEPDIQSQISNLNCFATNDVFFAISYSGESKDILKAALIAKNKGCIIISLTRFIPNSLAQMSDINIKIGASEEYFRISSITSRIAQLSAIDVIFVNLLKNYYDEFSKNISESKELINEYNLWQPVWLLVFIFLIKEF